MKTTGNTLVSDIELAIYKKRKEEADIILALYGFIYGFVMYLQMVNPTYLYGVLNKLSAFDTDYEYNPFLDKYPSREERKNMTFKGKKR